MSKRTVNPSNIKTLKDWVESWPKAGNLSFDPDTREPTIFTATKERSKVGSIPWKREGDIIVLATQSADFSAAAVTAARKVLRRRADERQTVTDAAAEQLRNLETAVLEAWRAYGVAVPAEKPARRLDIIAAERAYREMENAVAGRLYPFRQAVVVESKIRGTESHVVATNPIVPNNMRAVSLAVIAATE